MDFDVVVTGAGPVGLMLAGELRLGGASVLVIERQTEWNAPLKAGSMGARSINAPSADAFDRRGLLDAVREKALWWFQPSTDLSRAPEHAGHFAGLPVRTALLDPADLDLRGNPLGGGVISVLDLETILAERASALGAQIRRGVELTGLRAGPDGVVVEAGGESITTSWLVGCDGGRSTVRALAGFAFPGTDAEFVGRQAMVEFADPTLLPPGDWVHAAHGSYVHGPVPGRIHTVEYAPTPDRDAPVTAGELAESLRRVSGIDVEITHVRVATRYTDMTRQATTYRKDRVFLAGDAAHIHSPAGGQGLNLGIGDAMNLGWKLAAAVRATAPEGLLDTYTAERHPLGAWVQGWSDAQTALGRPDPRTRALRAVVADLLDSSSGATYVLKRISGLGRGYDLPGDHPLVGRPAPDVRLHDGARLAERFRPGRAVLIDQTGSSSLARLAAGWADRLIVGTAAEDTPTALIRPDGYVVWATDGEPDLDDLRTVLATWLGTVD